VKAMAVYGSVYGLSLMVARAVGQALAAGDAEVVPAGSVKPQQLAGLALLVVGLPTQRFCPIAPVTNLMKRIPASV